MTRRRAKTKEGQAGHNGQTSCHYRRSSLPPSFGLLWPCDIFSGSPPTEPYFGLTGMAAWLGTSHEIGGEPASRRPSNQASWLLLWNFCPNSIKDRLQF